MCVYVYNVFMKNGRLLTPLLQSLSRLIMRFEIILGLSLCTVLAEILQYRYDELGKIGVVIKHLDEKFNPIIATTYFHIDKPSTEILNQLVKLHNGRRDLIVDYLQSMNHTSVSPIVENLLGIILYDGNSTLSTAHFINACNLVFFRVPEYAANAVLTNLNEFEATNIINHALSVSSDR